MNKWILLVAFTTLAGCSVKNHQTAPVEPAKAISDEINPQLDSANNAAVKGMSFVELNECAEKALKFKRLEQAMADRANGLKLSKALLASEEEEI